MKKAFNLLFALALISMISCRNRGEEKKETTDPHEAIEAASDSIPTDGEDLGEYVNEKNDSVVVTTKVPADTTDQ